MTATKEQEVFLLMVGVVSREEEEVEVEEEEEGEERMR